MSVDRCHRSLGTDGSERQDEASQHLLPIKYKEAGEQPLWPLTWSIRLEIQFIVAHLLRKEMGLKERVVKHWCSDYQF